MKVTRSARRNARVFEAARKIIETRLPIQEVADEMDLSRHLVGLACIILTFGTPEQIASVEEAKTGMETVVSELRKTKNREIDQYIYARRFKAFSPDRYAKVRNEADIWTDLSKALMILSKLPPVSEIARMSIGHAKRSRTLTNTLEAASNWLKEYMDEWTKHQRSQEGINDAGNGDSVP